jgi:hypothetical protein
MSDLPTSTRATTIFLNEFISSITNTQNVDENWEKLSLAYVEQYNLYAGPKMAREELSFHNQVKLIAYLLMFMKDKVEGDNLEIGVWKGKSLALTEMFSNSGITIGVDYCAFEGQFEEISYFQKRFFPHSKIINKFSELATAEVFQSTNGLKLLHIDGGHERDNVWADFIIYSQLVIPGGFVVFDDYVDPLSPSVGPAIDELNELGFFSKYEIIGVLESFPSSFVLRKLHSD